MRGIVAAGLLVLTVAACSGQDPVEEPGVDVADVDQVDEQQGPVVADPVGWEVPVTVEGIGGDLEIVPEGLRYVSAEEISSPTDHDRPAREVFAVVRFTIATPEGSVTPTHGWGWRQDGQEYGPGDGGHAGTAPWMGAIPDVHTETVLVGGESPTVGHATFDLDQPGGELTFTGADGTVVRWTAPEDDQAQAPELEEWLSGQ